MIPGSRYIGSAFALGGNVLIAFALNTQKLAHYKLSHGGRSPRSKSSSTASGSGGASGRSARKGEEHGRDDDTDDNDEQTALLPNSGERGRERGVSTEQTKLFAISPSTNEVIAQIEDPIDKLNQLAEQGAKVVPVEVHDVSAQQLHQRQTGRGRMQKKFLDIRSKSRERDGALVELQRSRSRSDASRVESVDSGRPPNHFQPKSGRGGSRRPAKTKTPRTSRRRETPNGSYYKSKIWWLGILLMALGELGNFTSYAFAPASVVAPLGTTALIANCFIAPVMLKEKFRKKDLIGIALSVVGAVNVVLAGKSENRALNPHQLKHAIAQTAFIIYSSITLGLIILLAVLSRTKAGDKYLAIDIILCALFGGFTVLSTKAFSSFLTLMFLNTFKEWITYPILAVLVGTAICQVFYLNKALQRFESRVVVPTQFVSFTISAITGSAILYREFEDVSAVQVFEFFAGCLLVFIGVVILTRSNPSDEHTQRQAEDARWPASHDAAPGNTVATSMSATPQDAVTELPMHSSGAFGLSGQPTSTRIRQSSSNYPSIAGRSRSQDRGTSGSAIRKYASFGTFPRAQNQQQQQQMEVSSYRTSLHTPGTGPIRTSRTTHSLANARVFSPGYLLIAGSSPSNNPLLLVTDGRRGEVDDDDDDEEDDEEEGGGDNDSSSGASSDNRANGWDEDLESGVETGGKVVTRKAPRRSRRNTPRTESSRTQPDDDGDQRNTQLGSSTGGDQDEDDEDAETMTQSIVMNRSSTV